MIAGEGIRALEFLEIKTETHDQSSDEKPHRPPSIQKVNPLEQMKYWMIFLASFVVLSNALCGGVRFTASHLEYNDIGLFVWSRFIDVGKEPPSSWNELENIREMATDPKAHDLESMEKINAMAIVPGAPSIHREKGVMQSRWNHRIFAVGRTWNYDYSESKSNNDRRAGGRYAILITPENSMRTDWIPETEVGIILGRIPNFDPVKQPLAFENLEQLIHKERTLKSGLAWKQPGDRERHRILEASEQVVPGWDRLVPLVCIGLLLATCGGLVVMYRRARSTNANFPEVDEGDK